MPTSTTTAMLTNPISAPTSKEEGTKATDPTSLSTLEYAVRIFFINISCYKGRKRSFYGVVFVVHFKTF